MFEPAMFLGLGVVAVWAYVRYPRLRPGSLMRAVAHVAVSFVGFWLLPLALSLLMPVVQAHGLRVGVVLVLLFATLTYVLLSWVWLTACIADALAGGPRGGHPAATAH